jgi:tetratricopeptide (TPR) repeat protein
MNLKAAMKRMGLGLVIMIISLSLTAPLALAGATRPADKEAILKKAKKLIEQEPPNRQNLLEALSLLQGYRAQFPQEVRFPLYMAEAYYRLADPAADVNREFSYYEKTGQYAKKVMEMDPNRVEAHYWYGLFLLKEAQKRGLRGYFAVKAGIRELEKVRQSKPAYDHAGASRVLGLLYCLAPGWSPFGNLDKSIELGKEATRLAPNYMLNRLYLADAYQKRGDRQAAIKEYREILTLSAKTPGKLADGLSQQARLKLHSLDAPM